MTVLRTFPTEVWINILSQVTDMNELEALIRKIPEFRPLIDMFVTIICFRPDNNRVMKVNRKRRISSSVYDISFLLYNTGLKTMEIVDLRDQIDRILDEIRVNAFHRHLILEFCYKDESTFQLLQTVYRLISEFFLSSKESLFVSVAEEMDCEGGCCIQ
ncbi:hypothetical protein WICPIJ_007708 [Wickerhamomyces pijperi]|uniref:F-box domain-containing protein n=1 Tax=Wickerhamomyces pijperi TaxID=599730 RepID=A0A9P8Q192_WICPI|nr:hypothetical protein WICPIJ_007708 [Wickerhamomyces pijperi]